MPLGSRLPCTMRLLPLVAGLAASGLAHAEANPYYIGASQRVSHESNVYLVADGTPAQSDTLYTTSLIGGIDQPIGRERLFGNVALRHTSYGSQKELNNNGYTGTLGLDWATIDRISGNFTYTGSRDLAQLNADTGTNFKTRNLETSQQFDATARIGVVTRLTGLVNYNYRNLSYSDSTYRYREFDQNALSLGLNYSSSSALTFGVAVKRTDGKYPTYSDQPFNSNFPYFKDNYSRNDYSLTTQWIPSGASTINARLSFSKEDHEQAAGRSFSGTTGNLSWDWRPTGKLQFVTSLARDTGQESTFYQRSLVSDTSATSTGDNSQVTNSAQVVAKYLLSSKITINANVRGFQRSLTNQLENREQSGRDRTTAASLGARWAILRNVDLGCDVSRERRSSNILALSQPYSSNSFGCYGQVKLD